MTLPSGLSQSVLHQISGIVRDTSLSGTTVTLRQSDFAGIEVMAAFFTQVLDADELVITQASVLPAQEDAAWLAITGTAQDLLDYGPMRVVLCFSGPDEDVVIRLQGDLPEDDAITLPVVRWIALNRRRVVIQLTGRYALVDAMYQGQATGTSGSTTSPLFLMSVQRTSLVGWRLRAGGGEGYTRSVPDIVAALRRLEPGDWDPTAWEALFEETKVPVPLSVAQLAALMGAPDLASWLPSSLIAALQNIALSGLAAEVQDLGGLETVTPPPALVDRYDEAPEWLIDDARQDASYAPRTSIPSFSVTVSATNGWTAVPSVLVIKPGLSLTLVALSDGAQTVGQVTGVLSIGTVDVAVFVQALSSGTWVVGLQPGYVVVLPSLAALLAMAGGNAWFSALPAGFTTLPTIALERLLLSFSPTTAAVQQLDFTFSTGSVWVLLPGYFSVTHLRAGVDVRPEGATWSPSIDLLGVFDIGGVPIQCGLNTPGSGQPWTFTCGLPLGGSVNLTAIARALLPGKRIPSNAPNLVFDTLRITVTPSNSYLGFRATSETPWRITPTFDVEYFNLDFTYLSGRITGVVRSSLTLAGLKLDLSADLDATPDGGWRFTGAMSGQNLPIGALMASLAERFGVTAALPEPLRSLRVTALSVAFVTQTMDFVLRCDSTLTVGESPVALQLEIELRRGANGLYQKKLGGWLSIVTAETPPNRYDYALVFSQSADMSALLAVYHDGRGRGVNIKALLSALTSQGLGSIPNWTFGVYQASFALVGSTFLFALNMEGGINLSNLPLIGQMLPANETLRLDYQVLYTSGRVPDTTLGALNSLMPTAFTPLPVPVGGLNATSLLLSTKITLGSSVATLNLPVAIAPGGGLAPSAAPQASTAGAGGAEPVWVSLQRQVGPVHFSKVGGKVQGERLTLLLDASLALTGLSMAMDGLSVTTPLDALSPTFGLLGMSVAWQQGSLQVAGAFLRSTTTSKGIQIDSYSGLATVTLPKLSVAALGSYSSLNGSPSLFVYGVLDAPLGGAPFFYVKGLSAGFGYNRGFKAPAIDDVASFPLVTAATSGVRSVTASSLSAMLSSLGSAVPPQVGSSFLSLGVKWSSFRILDAFALATVSVGDGVEIDVLGLGTATVPSREDNPTTPPLAVAELALKAHVSLKQGVASVVGQLTPTAYIFSPTCKVTGGFAVYSWFSGIKKGDFVLTLGGYHPSFQRPDHYPVVPRLGFNWEVDTALVFKGAMYCAVTPASIMAGGRLEATYDSGDLKVTFTSDTNFLIGWKPYAYSGRNAVSVKGSYTFTGLGRTKTVSVSVGANLDLWGPELSGKMTLKLTLVTITIRFGKAPQPKTSLAPMPEPPHRRFAARRMSRRARPLASLAPTTWAEFQESFLPDSGAVSASASAGLQEAGDPDASPPPGVPAASWGGDMGTLDPRALRVVAESAFPATSAEALGVELVGAPFGVRPMGLPAGAAQSPLQIRLTGPDGAPVTGTFVPTAVYAPMPTALWGAPVWRPPLTEPATVDGLLVGVRLDPQIPDLDVSASLPTAAIQGVTQDASAGFAWGPVIRTSAGDEPAAERRRLLAEGLADPEVARERRALLAAFGVESPEVDIGAGAAAIFRVPPRLATGSTPTCALAVEPEDLGELGAPAAVQVEVVMDGLQITWLPLLGATGYAVSLTGAGDAPEVSVIGTTASTAALPPGSAWTVRVRGEAGSRSGPWSAPVAVAIPASEAVARVTVLNTPDAIEVAWTRVRGAIAYLVTLWGAGGDARASARIAGLATRFPADTLEDGALGGVTVEPLMGPPPAPLATFHRQSLDRPAITELRFDDDAWCIQVAWSAVAGARRYELALLDASGRLVRPPSPVGTEATALALDAATLDLGASYRLSVRALAEGVASAWSTLGTVEVG